MSNNYEKLIAKKVLFDKETLKKAQQLGIEFEYEGKESEVLGKVIAKGINSEFDSFIAKKTPGSQKREA